MAVVEKSELGEVGKASDGGKREDGHEGNASHAKVSPAGDRTVVVEEADEELLEDKGPVGGGKEREKPKRPEGVNQGADLEGRINKGLRQKQGVVEKIGDDVGGGVANGAKVEAIVMLHATDAGHNVVEQEVKPGKTDNDGGKSSFVELLGEGVDTDGRSKEGEFFFGDEQCGNGSPVAVGLTAIEEVEGPGDEKGGEGVLVEFGGDGVLEGEGEEVGDNQSQAKEAVVSVFEAGEVDGDGGETDEERLNEKEPVDVGFDPVERDEKKEDGVEVVGKVLDFPDSGVGAGALAPFVEQLVKDTEVPAEGLEFGVFVDADDKVSCNKSSDEENEGKMVGADKLGEARK